MSLSNYTQLQTSIASWAARQDMTDVIPDFVALVEARLRRILRGRDGVVRTSLVLSAAANDLPGDIVEPRSLYLTGTGVEGPIDIVTPEDLHRRKRSWGSATGVPKWGAIVGSELLLVPTPDDSYAAELVYMAEITPLAEAGSGTNWVLTNHPDIYLFGALSEAEPFLKNDERMALWQRKYDQALAELRLHQDRAEFGSNSPAVRPSHVLG